MKHYSNPLSYHAVHKAHCILHEFIEDQHPLTSKEVKYIGEQLHIILDFVVNEVLTDTDFIDEQIESNE